MKLAIFAGTWGHRIQIYQPPRVPRSSFSVWHSQTERLGSLQEFLVPYTRSTLQLVDYVATVIEDDLNYSVESAPTCDLF